MLSLCYLHAISMLSPCYLLDGYINAIFMLSPCYLKAISMLSLCYISVSCHPRKIITKDVFSRFFISFNTINIILAQKCLWGLEFPLKILNNLNKPKMACSCDLSKMAIMDYQGLYQGLLRTIKDNQGLSRTIKDYQGLSRTINDCQVLSVTIKDCQGL